MLIYVLWAKVTITVPDTIRSVPIMSLTTCKFAPSLKKRRLRLTVTSALAAARLAEIDMGSPNLFTAKDMSSVPVAHDRPTPIATAVALGGKEKLSLNKNAATVPAIKTPMLIIIMVLPALRPRLPACLSSVNAIPINRAGIMPPMIIPCICISLSD